ncbi:MAG TPA: hypothetical protein VH113_12725 [Gemmatimonadales bacterium]|jgi:wyosine [tRNA(Phe)-imidazoG37] synthetase (radical SAM superfamily)|nr:hypothetical protein [Gemmatimonadales bacterium]
MWGTRWPSPDEIAQGVRRALTRRSEPPRWITLSGNGDPALHPRFAVVIDRVLATRDALAPSAGVAVLSSSVSVGVPSLRDALRRVDAGTLEAWRRLVVQTAPDRVEIYPWGAVPRERLEEMAGALRDALPDVMVDAF